MLKKHTEAGSMTLTNASHQNTTIPSKLSPLKEITESIKKTLNNYNTQEMKDLIRKHYIQLRLMDNMGNWAAPELQKISSFLVPEDFDQVKAGTFVDTIAGLAKRNPFILDFLNRASTEKFSVLSTKVREEGGNILPDVIAYALVLDKLTNAMYMDWNFIEVCEKIWTQACSNENIYSYMDTFEKAKVLSIRFSVRRFIKFHKTGKVGKNTGKFTLPINVIEATLTDIKDGRKDNAKVGWTLTFNGPNCKKYDATSTHFSDNGKAIHYGVPLPVMWNDLYSTWNLAFVSRYQNFPYFMAKLLTPQVSNYYDEPEAYLYNRVLALYIHIIHVIMERIDNSRTGRKIIEWHDEKLTQLWGMVNKESAAKYENTLSKLDPSWFYKINKTLSGFIKK